MIKLIYIVNAEVGDDEMVNGLELLNCISVNQ